jgi:hypothetical protein
MALTFWRRRRIDPMPRRDFAMASRVAGDPMASPSDDYLVEGEEVSDRPSAAAQAIQMMQVVVIIIIAVLSLAVFWLLGVVFNIL